MSPPEKERRSGKERRMDSICTQLCSPVVMELSRREEKLDRKLDAIHECMGTKIPSKLFWKLAGGIAFIVFIGIGGTLWDLQTSISVIATDVKVMKVTVSDTSDDLKSHLNRAERKNDRFDERLDKIEKGETYFNFHNKGSTP